MTTQNNKCDCEGLSCKEECTRNHTHKTFWCEKCHPERYEDDNNTAEKPTNSEKTYQVSPLNLQKDNNNVEEFIRDVTKVGSIPKSEVRRRLNEIIATHTASIEAKYENCPQCTGLREEYKKELRIKVESMELRSTRDYMDEPLDFITKRDVLDLINNNQK